MAIVSNSTSIPAAQKGDSREVYLAVSQLVPSRCRVASRLQRLGSDAKHMYQLVHSIHPGRRIFPKPSQQVGAAERKAEG